MKLLVVEDEIKMGDYYSRILWNQAGSWSILCVQVWMVIRWQ